MQPPLPIVAIAAGPVGRIAATGIRARHGFALTTRDGEPRAKEPSDAR